MSSVRCLIVFLIASYVGASFAQTALPTVTNIADFFIPIGSEVEEGTQPKLVSKGSVESKKLLGANLKVRVFTLNPGESLPVAITSHGNCELFFTVTFPVSGAGNSLTLMKTNANWLSVSTIENTVKEGRYWVVLESANDTPDKILLLHKEHRVQYFSSGFLLVVKPRTTVSNEQIVNAFKARRKSLEAAELEASENIGALTCYGFKRLFVGIFHRGEEQSFYCATEVTPANG